MALTQMLTIKVSQEDYKSLTRKSSNEGRDNLVEGSVRLGAEVTIGTNLVQKGLLGSLDVSEELLLELGDLGRVDFVQESPDAAIDDGHLVLNGHGDVLALLEQLSQSDTSVEELLSGGIKIRSELGESSDLEGRELTSWSHDETLISPLCTEPTRASWTRPPAS